MPITNSQFTLDDETAVRVCSPSNMPHRFIIHNHSKSSNQYAFLGGSSTVTTSNGMHLDPGATLSIDMAVGDELWAISNIASLTVGVVNVRQPS